MMMKKPRLRGLGNFPESKVKSRSAHLSMHLLRNTNGYSISLLLPKADPESGTDATGSSDPGPALKQATVKRGKTSQRKKDLS